MTENRHDRTNRLLEPYLKNQDLQKFYTKTIVITGDNYLETENSALIAKTLVNLVARFANNLIISLPSNFAILQDELESIAKKIGVKTSTEIPKQPDIVLSVGNVTMECKFVIRLFSDGWASFFSCNKPISISNNQGFNPIGAMGSACFGATECFKRLLELTGNSKKIVTNHSNNFMFSFLDYSISNNNSDFPKKIQFNENILLVGNGAVGSSFVYGLNQIPNVFGSVSVVDNDKFDESNLNRSPIAFIENLDQNKAIITKEYETSNLKFKAYPISYAEFQEQNQENFPIVLSTVDNNDVRYEIQSDLPKIILHGSTGDVLVSISVIKFLENACLCCIFDSKENLSHEEVLSNDTGIPVSLVAKAIQNDENFTNKHLEFLISKLGIQANKFKQHIGKSFKEVYTKEICGEINVRTEEGVKHPTVSFVSFFAGLAILSELIKYCSDMNNTPLLTKKDFFRINMFKPVHIGPPHRYQKNSKCMLNCSAKSIHEIFEKLWEAQK